MNDATDFDLDEAVGGGGSEQLDEEVTEAPIVPVNVKPVGSSAGLQRVLPVLHPMLYIYSIC